MLLTLARDGADAGALHFRHERALFWPVATLLNGFEVAGFWSAFFGSILYSIVSWLLSALIFGQRNFG